MSILKSKVALAGDGWGALAAFKGLKTLFEGLSIITNDNELVRLMGAMDKRVELEHLENYLIIFSGYKPIVNLKTLNNNKCINIHYSLLPKYRGLHSTVWAILNNEDELGFTLYEMNEFIDDGDILFQYRCKNDYKKTAADYIRHFNELLSKDLGQIIKRYLKGDLVLLKQDKSKATWVGKRNLKDCHIDFNQTNIYINAFFRALSAPYPLPFFIHKGNIIKVLKYRIHTSNCETHIGRVLNVDNEGVWIKVREGYLIVEEMEDENGKTYPSYKFRIGQYLQ